MAAQNQQLTCPAGAVCIFESQSDFSRGLFLYNLIPVALELFLYGIFVILFGVSIYVFWRKLMPGRIYVIAALLFLPLATASVVVDLVVSNEFINSVARGIPTTVVLLPGHTFELQSVNIYIFALAGLLGDFILMYRSYLLWKSRRYILILPALGALAIFIFGVVGPTRTASARTEKILSAIYLVAEILEGIFLTGLLAGRLWWLNRSTKKVLDGNFRSGFTLQNLVETVIGSGLLLPTFLVVVLILQQVAGPIALHIISACAVTQVAGIASTLVVIHVGLSMDAQVSEPWDSINAGSAESDVDSITEKQAVSISNKTASSRPFSRLPRPRILLPEQTGNTIRRAADVEPFTLNHSSPTSSEKDVYSLQV